MKVREFFEVGRKWGFNENELKGESGEKSVAVRIGTEPERASSTGFVQVRKAYWDP